MVGGVFLKACSHVPGVLHVSLVHAVWGDTGNVQDVSGADVDMAPQTHRPALPFRSEKDRMLAFGGLPRRAEVGL